MDVAHVFEGGVPLWHGVVWGTRDNDHAHVADKLSKTPYQNYEGFGRFMTYRY